MMVAPGGPPIRVRLSVAPPIRRRAVNQTVGRPEVVAAVVAAPELQRDRAQTTGGSPSVRPRATN